MTTLLKIFLVVVSLIMVGISFSPDREIVQNHSILENLFVICTFLYIPLFFISLVVCAVEAKRKYANENPASLFLTAALFFLLPMFALYRFNDWFFRYIL